MPGSTPAFASVDGEADLRAPRSVLWWRIARHRGFLVGAGILALIMLAALCAPLLAPQDPYAQSLANRMIPPAWNARGNWAHPLGTDHLGRDYLARLLHGARISLTIGLLAASIGALIGSGLGIVAGYFGGRIDQLAGLLLHCQLALPTALP